MSPGSGNYAAIDQCLLAAVCTAANLPHPRDAVNRWARQMDTIYHYKNHAAYYVSSVNKTIQVLIKTCTQQKN